MCLSINTGDMVLASVTNVHLWVAFSLDGRIHLGATMVTMLPYIMVTIREVLLLEMCMAKMMLLDVASILPSMSLSTPKMER